MTAISGAQRQFYAAAGGLFTPEQRVALERAAVRFAFSLSPRELAELGAVLPAMTLGEAARILDASTAGHGDYCACSRCVAPPLNLRLPDALIEDGPR